MRLDKLAIMPSQLVRGHVLFYFISFLFWYIGKEEEEDIPAITIINQKVKTPNFSRRLIDYFKVLFFSPPLDNKSTQLVPSLQVW